MLRSAFAFLSLSSNGLQLGHAFRERRGHDLVPRHIYWPDDDLAREYRTADFRTQRVSRGTWRRRDAVSTCSVCSASGVAAHGVVSCWAGRWEGRCGRRVQDNTPASAGLRGGPQAMGLDLFMVLGMSRRLLSSVETNAVLTSEHDRPTFRSHPTLHFRPSQLTFTFDVSSKPRSQSFACHRIACDCVLSYPFILSFRC